MTGGGATVARRTPIEEKQPETDRGTAPFWSAAGTTAVGTRTSTPAPHTARDCAIHAGLLRQLWFRRQLEVRQVQSFSGGQHHGGVES